MGLAVPGVPNACCWQVWGSPGCFQDVGWFHTSCAPLQTPSHPISSMGSLVLWWAVRLWGGLITTGGWHVGSLCLPGSGWPLACLSSRWWLPGDPPCVPPGDYSPVTMTIERSAKRSCVIPGSAGLGAVQEGGLEPSQPLLRLTSWTVPLGHIPRAQPAEN